MANETIDFVENEEENIDLRKMFFSYLRYWYWFIFSIGFTVTVAFVYLRYTTPIYNISSVLLIKDEKRGWGE
jgi:uncharacterized protein involved in exopolysaccharide biosynthesis